MSNIATKSRFQELIEMIESLPYEDQEILIDIISRRLAQIRRARLLKEISESLDAYERGDVRRGTVDDFMKDIDNS
ncbi:MAG: hypothetical protein ACPL7B_08385 [Candidatus Poribacteria bacterium]